MTQALLDTEEPVHKIAHPELVNYSLNRRRIHKAERAAMSERGRTRRRAGQHVAWYKRHQPVRKIELAGGVAL